MFVAVALTSPAGAARYVAPATAGPPQRPSVAHLDFDGFFPSTTKVHVGDSVSWQLNGFHTVTFLAKGQAQPPLIIVNPASPITGKLDAAGASFFFNGQPRQEINPMAGAPSGSKTYAGGFLNSGPPEESSAAEAVRRQVHQSGHVHVPLPRPSRHERGRQGAPEGQAGAVGAEDKAAALAQEAADIKQARKLAKVKPPAATVLAGNDGSGSVAWLRFFPETLRVKAGTTVHFKISSKREIHTVTIGPPAYTGAIESTFTARWARRVARRQS